MLQYYHNYLLKKTELAKLILVALREDGILVYYPHITYTHTQLTVSRCPSCVMDVQIAQLATVLSAEQLLPVVARTLIMTGYQTPATAAPIISILIKIAPIVSQL